MGKGEEEFDTEEYLIAMNRRICLVLAGQKAIDKRLERIENVLANARW
jgi:hypothetical protein